MAVSFLRFQFPCLPNVHCAFQKRSNSSQYSLAGNISFKAGDKNGTLQTRKELLAQLQKVGLDAWSECNQVHGDRLLVNPQGVALECEPDSLPQADGMMTDEVGLGLMIKTADCQPILLAHKSGEYIMAIHSGWRGNRMDFPGTAVAAFCNQYNIKPCDILAVRGPSLGPGAAEFVNFEQEWGPVWRRWYCEKTKCLDLWAMARYQLNEAGIPDSQIYELDICTWLNDSEFFSWRRDKNTGRQASLIWIAKSTA